MSGGPFDFDGTVLAACAAAFAETVQYVTTGGQVPVPAIYDDAYYEEKWTTDGTLVSTTRPVLGIRQSDMPAGSGPNQGDSFVVRGITMVVTDSEPDGIGMLRVTLRNPADPA